MEPDNRPEPPEARKSLSECFRPLTPEEVQQERHALLEAIAQTESDLTLSPAERECAAAGWRDILADLDAGEFEMYDPGEDE